MKISPSSEQQSTHSHLHQSFLRHHSAQTFFSKEQSARLAPFFNQTKPEPTKSTNLTVGAAGDRYEKEADQIADQAVQNIHSASSSPSSLTAGTSLSAQRKESVNTQQPSSSALGQNIGPQGGNVSSHIEHEIRSAKGTGQTLPSPLQDQMEHAMGADFSHVRIHTDTRAEHLNHAMQAKAFTTGKDVFFRPEAYQPTTQKGQRLIAHELAHVVQQSDSQADVHRKTDALSQDQSQVIRRAEGDAEADEGDREQYDKQHKAIMKQAAQEAAAKAQHKNLMGQVSQAIPGAAADMERRQQEAAAKAQHKSLMGQVSQSLPSAAADMERRRQETAAKAQHKSLMGQVSQLLPSAAADMEQRQQETAAKAQHKSLMGQVSQSLPGAAARATRKRLAKEAAEKINKTKRIEYGNTLLENRSVHPAVNSPQKANNPSLGEDLAAIQPSIASAGYEFNRPEDSQGMFERVAKRKARGTLNYLKKHPGKSLAKAGGLGIFMSGSGAVKSHYRAKSERQKQQASSSEAQAMMLRARKKSQLKQRTKQTVNTLTSGALLAAGGGVDFGAGELVNQGVSAAVEGSADLGSQLLSNLASEGTENVMALAAEDPARAIPAAFGEAAAEEMGGSGLEDMGGAARKQKSDSRYQGLHPTARKARLALNDPSSTEADKATAHESMLAKDLKYGDAARAAVRSTLTVPKPSEVDHRAVVDQQRNVEDSQGNIVGSSDLEIGNQHRVVKHLAEIRAQAEANGLNEDALTKPSDVVSQVDKTPEGRNQRLRTKFSYDKQTLADAEASDAELFQKMEKSWYEA